MIRRAGLIVVALLLGFIMLALYGYAEATRDPVVRSANFLDPQWPSNYAPVRLVLIADLHVQGPDMPPERLVRIVSQVNALHPDVVVLAGDFATSNPYATRTYSLDEAVEPLRALHSKLGEYAVLGNHDRSDPDDARAALESVGINVLENDAVQLGPLAIAGVHRRLAPALRALRKLHGMKILVAHSPDPFSRLPATIPLMLAGHTHCGQVVLPLVGALDTGSRFGSRYLCGLVRESGKTLIVTAGLGTSRIPIRLGAPPDLWLITIGPPQSVPTPGKLDEGH